MSQHAIMAAAASVFALGGGGGGGPPPFTGTIRYAEGWSGYAFFPWPPTSSINTNSARKTGKAAGRYCLSINGSGNRWLYFQPAGMTGDYLVLGVALEYETEAQAVILAINRGGTGDTTQSANTCVRFQLETNGDLTVLDSTGATIGTISGFGSAWHWLDVKVHAVDAGTIDVAVDGVAILTAAAGDFAGGSATGNTWTVFFTDDQDAGSDNPDAANVGELLIGYGDGSTPLLGERVCYPLYPDGVDSAGSFTPNTGGFAAAIDEGQQNADTDYVSSSTDPDEFYCTLGDLVPTVGDVACIKHTILARKTTGASNVTPQIKSGATVQAGPTTALTTDYGNQVYQQIEQNDPATSAAWTIAAINALKAGAKMTGAGDLRVTQSYVEAFIA